MSKGAYHHYGANSRRSLEGDAISAAQQRNAAMAKAPPGAQTYQDGQFYKLKVGRLWYHDGIEWCCSNRQPHEVIGVYE